MPNWVLTNNLWCYFSKFLAHRHYQHGEMVYFRSLEVCFTELSVGLSPSSTVRFSRSILPLIVLREVPCIIQSLMRSRKRVVLNKQIYTKNSRISFFS